MSSPSSTAPSAIVPTHHNDNIDWMMREEENAWVPSLEEYDQLFPRQPSPKQPSPKQPSPVPNAGKTPCASVTSSAAASPSDEPYPVQASKDTKKEQQQGPTTLGDSHHEMEVDMSSPSFCCSFSSPHWYERERQAQDGAILPRVPSVVPTNTTIKCKSYTCSACRNSSHQGVVSPRFEDTTAAKPLPRLKRRWWEFNNDNDDDNNNSVETRNDDDCISAKTRHKRQRTKDIDTTPFHWALELQGWIDSKLTVVLDDAMDESDSDDNESWSRTSSSV